ncbi:5-oxoprolinase subunit PxpB [Chromatiaceae bacterium AAb-1]|nr:5-oxoprolinase subunit PxpB [Chromatiaceae bacterium AAb-1]
MTAAYRLEIASENAFILYFGQKIDPDISRQVRQAQQQLQQAMAAELIDLIPSYASLLIIFNPLSDDHSSIEQKICLALQSPAASTQQSSRCIELPVYYSEESGPDLPLIARSKELSVEEVIRLHQAVTYQVYAIGFAPGFAYLGEVDARLEMPRLASPRAKVPAGSVAIADRQTAVYPAVSPGGWNLIGLCPVNMFSAAATPPMPVATGDQVKFVAISKAEFLKLGGIL